MGYAGLLERVSGKAPHSFLITLASLSPFLASKPQQDKNTLWDCHANFQQYSRRNSAIQGQYNQTC